MDLREILLNFCAEDADEISAEELTALVFEMLQQLGSTDEALRDGLIYPALADILGKNVLDVDILRHMLETCLDEKHLFFKLGQTEDDSVFMRSFSCAVITEMVRADARLNFLTPEGYENLYTESGRYLEQEKDMRGYISEKGWAHTMAHGADLLAALVYHKHFTIRKFLPTLALIEKCLHKDEALSDGEDMRLVFALRAVMTHGFGEEEIKRWLREMTGRLAAAFDSGGYTRQNYQNTKNVSNFMKSFYFMLKIEGANLALRAVLFEKIKELHGLKYTR